MKKYLIVGLGNIGEEYRYTRHNIGFSVLDHLAHLQGVGFTTQKLGDVASLNYKGRNLLLLKPSTYMNLSGKAVRYYLEKENIPLEHLLVVTDDLNLPFGSLRLKPKGSDGGHNGLKNIQLELGTVAYPRLRFGISNSFSLGGQIDYVLGKWREEEVALLPERLDVFAQAILSFAFAGINNTMNTFNNK